VLQQLPVGTILRADRRRFARWARAPHYEQSRAVYEDQHLKKFDRAAWVQKKLSAEVAELRAAVEQMGAAA